MAEIVSGISEVGIDRLIMDLYDYSEKCTKLSNRIRDLVENTRDYYKTKDGILFRKNFEKFYLGTEKLNKNILSVVSDLNNIKSNYRRRDVNSAEIIRTAAKKVQKKER